MSSCIHGLRSDIFMSQYGASYHMVTGHMIFLCIETSHLPIEHRIAHRISMENNHLLLQDGYVVLLLRWLWCWGGYGWGC